VPLLVAITLSSSAGCGGVPKPIAKDITLQASAYTAFAKGQKFRLRRDAITNGGRIDDSITVSNEGSLHKISVPQFKSRPSSYPGYSILPAGTLLQVERILLIDNVTWSTTVVSVRVLNGKHKGSLQSLDIGLLAGVTATKNLRPNPQWLQAE